MLTEALTATRTVANQVADAINVIREGFHRPYTPVKTEITGALRMIVGTAEFGLGHAMQAVGRQIEGVEIEHGRRLIQLGGEEFIPGFAVAVNAIMITGFIYTAVTYPRPPLDPIRIESLG